MTYDAAAPDTRSQMLHAVDQLGAWAADMMPLVAQVRSAGMTQGMDDRAATDVACFFLGWLLDYATSREDA